MTEAPTFGTRVAIRISSRKSWSRVLYPSMLPSPHAEDLGPGLRHCASETVEIRSGVLTDAPTEAVCLPGPPVLRFSVQVHVDIRKGAGTSDADASQWHLALHLLRTELLLLALSRNIPNSPSIPALMES